MNSKKALGWLKVIALIVIAFFLLAKFKKIANKLFAFFGIDTKQDVAIDHLSIQESKLTITEAAAHSIANALEQELSSTFWITFDKIYQPLQNFNKYDLRLVYKAFGTRLDLHHFGSFDLINWFKNRMKVKAELDQILGLFSNTGLL